MEKKIHSLDSFVWLPKCKHFLKHTNIAVLIVTNSAKTCTHFSDFESAFISPISSLLYEKIIERSNKQKKVLGKLKDYIGVLHL